MKKYTQEEKEEFVKSMYKDDDQVGEWDVEEAILALQQLGEAMENPFWVHQE